MSASKPKKKSRFWIGLLVLVLIGGATWWARRDKKKPTAVQTAKVQRQELASTVTASGEIKPLHWVQVSTAAFGQIVKIHVKEGDRVKKGQLLVNLESVQQGADVSASRASLAAAEADVKAGEAAARSGEAALASAEADLARAKADAERAKADFNRVDHLVREKLVSRSEFDTSRATMRMTEAAVQRANGSLSQTTAQVEQTKAQLARAHKIVEQVRSNLTRLSNVLTKHTIEAPLDGVVTNLPVHEGENVVIGIQNSPGSTLMTIADMTTVVAEVKVDETDIVNVKLGEPAEVTIDALPEKKFKGKVIEIGNTAILRSSGQTTSLANNASQEAKDFKVLVLLEDPPQNLRPGFSTTAKIETARKKGILTAPIQAITVRTPAQLVPMPETGKLEIDEKVKRDKTETQGIFVVRGERVEFVPVKTGITGITDVEINGEFKDGDEVVTGSYKVLRSLRPKARVSVENDVDTGEETGS